MLRLAPDLPHPSTQVELIEGGSLKKVTFHNRHKFCDLAIAARLKEGVSQCRELLSGLRSVVPSVRLLSLLTGHDLELLT